MPSFWPFNLRRDSSVDQIPVAGLQDGVDAIDVIQWGSLPWTETLNTDSSGIVTLTYHPIDVSHDWQLDDQLVGRERKVDGADVSAETSGGATLYPGAANVATKRVPLFTDGALTAAATNLSGVVVTYRRLVPLTLDQNGNLVTVSGGGTGTVVDIADRAARSLGQVSPVSGTVWDVADRVARQLGVTGRYLGTSVSARGYIGAPGAGLAIASIPSGSLGAGFYEVEAFATVFATNDSFSDNVRLQHGSTNLGQIPAWHQSNGIPPKWTFPRVQVNAAEALSLTAVQNAGAGSFYYCTLTATPVP